MLVQDDVAKIFCGDAKNLNIENNSVDLVITHPPYWNVDPYRYGGDPYKQVNNCEDRMDYIKNLIDISIKIYDVLKHNGSFIICVGNESSHYFFVELMNLNIMNYASSFIIDYSDGKHMESDRGLFQTWFHFYKGDKYFANPFELKKRSGSICKYHINNMKSDEDKKLMNYGFNLDALNLEFAEHLVKCYSKSGDTVLDPFGGSGVVMVASLQNSRKAIYNDVSEDAVLLAQKRLELYGLAKSQEFGITVKE